MDVNAAEQRPVAVLSSDTLLFLLEQKQRTEEIL